MSENKSENKIETLIPETDNNYSVWIEPATETDPTLDPSGYCLCIGEKSEDEYHGSDIDPTTARELARNLLLWAERIEKEKISITEDGTASP